MNNTSLKEKKEIEVVAAIIEYQEKFLCVQRGENKLSYISKKYEFPGGKVEEGETQNQALIREIREELEMDIEPINLLLTVNHEYPDFKIKMHGILCKSNSDSLTLTEHIDYKWLSKSELAALDWAEADIPIVKILVK